MYTEPKSGDPVDTCFSCDCAPHIACHACKVLHRTLHVSILCQSEICVGLRQFWAANIAAAAVAFVAVVASAVNTRPGVWICRKVSWCGDLTQVVCGASSMPPKC